jgi:phosphate acetyltransferase
MSFFIASTGQNVGKTTLSLGLIASLKKRGVDVTYMKPIGQEQVETEGGLFVDKDVLLMKEHFHLEEPYEAMSPVLIPTGFTKNFLNGKIQTADLSKKITDSFQTLTETKKNVIVEGTGHVGVGSLIELNNAEVAKKLNLPLILISSGGVGSAFDELALNKALCDLHEVQITGVILNRVRPEKREMVIHYMNKALQRWNIPLLGCLPLDSLLTSPSLQDIALLIKGEFLSGQDSNLQHFAQVRLAAVPVEIYREMIQKGELIITPSSREDIILATISKSLENPKMGLGLILTGDLLPRNFLIEELKKANIPTLYTLLPSDKALAKINAFTAKIQKEDQKKIQEAIDVVDTYVDFQKFL